MSSMHLLPWRFDVEWSSKCPRPQHKSGCKGTANNNKNLEFRSSTPFSSPNVPKSTGSLAPMVLHHALELSTWLVVDSTRLLLYKTAILLSTVSIIFESKKCRRADSRKASTSVELRDKTSCLPSNIRGIHLGCVPECLDLKGCSARLDGANDR